MRRRQGHSIANCHGWLAGWPFASSWSQLCVVPFLSDALLDSVGAALALWSRLCTHQPTNGTAAGGQIYMAPFLSLCH